MKRALRWSIAIIMVAACTALAGWWFMRPSWPEFPATDDAQPQVQVFVDRDYAYRIGDVVPLEVVIRQQPGTRVQVTTLTVSGDFEMHEKPTLETKELQNGAALYRLRFKLQSFEPKPRLSFGTSFTWDDLQKNEQHNFQMPEKKIGTGMTWDGRQEMQEGDDGVTMLWLWLKALVPLTIGSTLFVYFLVRALLLWLAERKKPTEAELLRNHFRRLLATVSDGTCQCEGFRELEKIVRTRWNVESVAVDDLATAIKEPSWVQPVTEFLALTALGIYPSSRPAPEAVARLPELGEALIPGLMSPPASAGPVPASPS